MAKGDFLIDFSFLDEKQQKDISQLSKMKDSGEFDNDSSFGVAVYEKQGKCEMVNYNGNLPFFIEDEEILWHREIIKGIFKKKLKAFEAITNFRTMFFDMEKYRAISISLMGYDAVVNNQKRISASQREGDFAGIANRGIFIGMSGSTSTSESQTIGDVNLMADGHIDFTFYSVPDPHGLSRLLKNVIKSQNELGKKLDEQRGIKKELGNSACKQCDFQNPRDSKFCNKCGMKIKSGCTQCGKINPSDSSFCNGCGFALQ